MAAEERMVLSTSDEAATYRTDLKGWVSRDGLYYGENGRTARWSGATHVPCGDCGEPTRKSYTKCDACREKYYIARYAALERRPYDGGYLYSDALSRYFDDADDLLDFVNGADEPVTLESLRLVLCDKEFAHEIDGDDLFCDQLPEDCSLDDVAGDIADAIAKVNEIIAERRREGRQLSWMPSKFAVDLSTLEVTQAARRGRSRR